MRTPAADELLWALQQLGCRGEWQSNLGWLSLGFGVRGGLFWPFLGWIYILRCLPFSGSVK